MSYFVPQKIAFGKIKYRTLQKNCRVKWKIEAILLAQKSIVFFEIIFVWCQEHFKYLLYIIDKKTWVSEGNDTFIINRTLNFLYFHKFLYTNQKL